MVPMRYSPATGQSTNTVSALGRMRAQKGAAQTARASQRASLSKKLAKGRAPRQVVMLDQNTVLSVEGMNL